jgi:hypothetical protein
MRALVSRTAYIQMTIIYQTGHHTTGMFAVNRLVMGIVTAALFLGSSELWSRQAPPLLWGVSIFGALGYLMAAYLGYRLLRAVRKSGDIQSKD